LIQDNVVVFPGRDLAHAETSGAEENGEADDDSAEVPFQNDVTTNSTRFYRGATLFGFACTLW
jgi:hypothetical protein